MLDGGPASLLSEAGPERPSRRSQECDGYGYACLGPSSASTRSQECYGYTLSQLRATS